MYHGDKTYIGQPYYVDDETGEGHFRGDWLKISSYEIDMAIKIIDPKHGQKVGYWTIYDKKYGWHWTGPRNG